MITKPEQHDIDRAGRRLLREVLEPLGWVVNDVQEDYGIDSNVQVFDAQSPTGAWFHVQLKSSAAPSYSADGSFISQELSIDHARHFALEMRHPIFLVHADVTIRKLHWYAPQLDRSLVAVVHKTGAKSIRVRIPTQQQLPESASDLLRRLETIHLVLAGREIVLASTASFEDSIKHLPDQKVLHKAFQEKNDSLKLGKIAELYREHKFDEARPRAEAILSDPDSTIETKFWARIQLGGIEFSETARAGKPQNELPKVILIHAKALQELTKKGPSHLKFYALIARKAAELDILVAEHDTLFMAEKQHLQGSVIPLKALAIHARRSATTQQIVVKYNQCLRLVRYAASYRDRWLLGRALVNIVRPIGAYLVALNVDNKAAADAFGKSALQICKLAARIAEETGDSAGVVVALGGHSLRLDRENPRHTNGPLTLRIGYRTLKSARTRWN